MGNDLAAAGAFTEPVAAARHALQEARATRSALLAVAATPTLSAALRHAALLQWHAHLTDLQLARVRATETLVHMAYTGDSAVRASARNVLVRRGVAASRDFDRRSYAETMAALPAALVA